MIGKAWIENWGVRAREAEVIDDGPGPNRIRLKDGLIYTFLKIPKKETPGKLIGQLEASGTGVISVWLSTCERPPGCKAKGFSHSTRKNAAPFELSESPQEFKFVFDIAPFEQGYMYIKANGEATLRHVSAVLKDTK